MEFLRPKTNNSLSSTEMPIKQAIFYSLFTLKMLLNLLPVYRKAISYSCHYQSKHPLCKWVLKMDSVGGSKSVNKTTYRGS